MRTTIRLPDDLLRQVKRLAVDTDRTLTKVIDDALREVVSRHRSSKPSKPIRLTTVGGGTAFPGVNLDDTSSLLDRMEGLDDPDRR